MEPHRVQLSTIATHIAASGDGHVFIEMRSNWDRDSDVILALYEHTGTLIWQKSTNAQFPRAIKVVKGQLYFCDGADLFIFDMLGQLLQTVSVQLAPQEWIGNYVVVDNGYYICTRESYPGPNDIREPRIIRLDRQGQQIWSATLPKPNQEQEKDSRWARMEWQPEYQFSPIMISGDRLLSTYFDLASGLSLGYCLDTITGELLWSTPLRPSGNRVSLSQGRFLIGFQGYDFFDSYLYTAEGSIKNHWKSHGYVVITEAGEVRIVEMENRLPSRMHVSVLEIDGTVRQGPHLDRYRTSYPVIDQQNNIWFWREGELTVVSADMKKRVVYSDFSAQPHLTMYSQMLLVQGKLILTICTYGGKNELLVFDTPEVSLANSIWPCFGGNLGTNPVVE
jgi:hypothetical protein